MRAEPAGQSKLAFLDYFFVLRPMLFFPGWSTFLAGYLIVQKNVLVAPTLFPFANGSSRFIIAVLAFTFAMGAGFIINQVYDVASDRRNKKLFIISDGHLSLFKARVEAWVLAALACLIPLGIDVTLAIAIMLFFLITGILYNLPPARLKDKPLGSLLANAAMGWLAFAIGWLINQSLSIDIIIDSLPYLLFNTALYLYTTLPDIDGDRTAGKNTLAVKFGVKSLANSAFVLIALSLVSAWMLNDRLALLFSVLTVPFAFIPVMSEKVADTIRATKYAILFFALAICLKIPLYFVLMCGGFFFTRIYFRHRFNFDYPTFKGQ